MCFGTSPERPQVDSYIVSRHLSETVPCRAPLNGFHNPGTSYERLCVDRQTSSRVLQHQPNHHHVHCISQNYSSLGTLLSHYSTKTRCSATCGHARVRIFSFNVPPSPRPPPFY